MRRGRALRSPGQARRAYPTLILAISGSLRAASTNTAVLIAAGRIAPAGVEVRLWDGLGSLPHFNPDLDVPPVPDAVVEFRNELRVADGVLISSPEYAHGVPGVLKNALDWVVGSGELMEKRVGVINASPYATFAYASLTETLRTMSAVLVDGACVTLPIRSGKPGVDEILAAPDVVEVLRGAIKALVG